MMTFLDITRVIFISQPESFVAFFLIWLKTNGVPSFHFESIRPFWFVRSCRFDIRLFAPLSRTWCRFHSNDPPPSCCNSPLGPFPYSLILNLFSLDCNGPIGSKPEVTWQRTYVDISAYFHGNRIFWKVDIFEKWIFWKVDISKSGYFWKLN